MFWFKDNALIEGEQLLWNWSTLLPLEDNRMLPTLTGTCGCLIGLDCMLFREGERRGGLLFKSTKQRRLSEQELFYHWDVTVCFADSSFTDTSRKDFGLNSTCFLSFCTFIFCPSTPAVQTLANQCQWINEHVYSLLIRGTFSPVFTTARKTVF